jgi:Tfp pilus tip-associated adhesin PilY1
VIQFAAGGDTAGAMGTSGALNNRPLNNRVDTIMGDVINSSPGVIEYNLSDVKTSLPKTLKDALNATTGVTNRFRLLLVGTNQGWLHAFGEISNITNITDPADSTKTVEKVSGAVDELWAFMPTDFLANLDYITQAGNSHQFMVDGTPSIYFLDLPPTTGGLGNGVLDWGSGGNVATTKERAIAVIGLRKGGRSYYALDIHDPFNPTLKWSLVPDEAAYFPQSRIASGGPDLATVQSILKTWGFSTCTPGLGRIMFNGVLRDAVFLGGGFSVPEVEANFPDSSGNATPLGRSVIALDVYTGEVLAAVDMSGTTAGPMASGIVPFEFILNSGMAQRAYFLDYKGGLWDWAKQAVSSTAPYVNYRTDSSELTDWSVRKVAQDGTGKNALYSTLPAPFRVGAFPGMGYAGGPSPATVGIAMISGDRNNPLDFSYTSTTRPSAHRLTVIFDRQDHKAWDSSDAAITDSSLLNVYSGNTSLQIGDPLITAGTQTYYLAPHDASGTATTPYLGYYRSLPATASGFTPKGINSPLVVAGSLFYSYFGPEAADPCTGGSGKTYANLICDVLNPIVADARTNVSCTSGTQFTWTGVASDFVTIGTYGVLQAGVVPAVNPGSGQSLTTIELQTILGNRLERFPKVRTWRTVH